MRRKQQIYLTFVILCLLSLFLLFFSVNQPILYIRGFAESIIKPLQKSAYHTLGIIYNDENIELNKLREENLELKRQVADLETVKKDNQALRDQFTQKKIQSQQLLPVSIIGSDAIIFGAQPTKITLDQGIKQGVKKGMAVIYKDNLVGIIIHATDQLSIAALIVNEKITLPVKTLQTNALGIAKGKNNSILIDQVVVSDSLKIGDLVVSKGEINEEGIGIPPELIIGKILAVRKKPSELFQSAKVDPIIDIKKLDTVFIVLTN